jgi:hypothetical protein
MKKAILAVVLVLCVTGLSFAEFEIDLGLFGGPGNASAAGLTLRLGYLSPALQTKAEKPKDYRWGLLLDGGFGIQLPFLFGTDESLYTDHREFTDEHEYSDEVNGLGIYYHFGLLGEYHFLPFMGVAVGAGVASGLLGGFVPYAKIEIPFFVGRSRLSIGFDYLFWNFDPRPITYSPGYRVTFAVLARNGLVGDILLGMILWPFWLLRGL